MVPGPRPVLHDPVNSMSLFPLLTSIRDGLFSFLPQGGFTGAWRKARQVSQGAVRPGHTTLRHWDHQGGLSITEEGEVALRAGHTLYDDAVGSSVSLTADGHVVITAPAGFILSGGSLYTSASPSAALAFQGGRLRLHPQWEKRVLVGTQVDDEELLATFFVAPGPGLPATVPLSDVLRLTALYQRSQDYYR